MRRGAIGAAVGLALAGAVACGPRPPPAPRPPPPVPLHLAPACDLAPAAGLSWIVEAKPRRIAAIDDLIPAVALVLPEARLDAFAARHGVDPRRVDDACIARYPRALLTIADAPIDAARVESAFAARATSVDQRQIDVVSPPVVRLAGNVGGEPTRLVIFDASALALEEGAPGPLRAAEAFALGKLRRARPALKSAALERLAAIVGDAPLRAFAPGPFEGETARGVGGLLRATTAVGASARYAGTASNVRLKVALAGAWGDDAGAAAERFAAAAHVVAESGVGHLLGLDHPVDGPRVRGTPDALVLEVTLDGMRLARGLRDATEADVAEIMAH